MASQAALEECLRILKEKGNWFMAANVQRELDRIKQQSNDK